MRHTLRVPAPTAPPLLGHLPFAWIHYEETEGRIRFDGNRDLRRFAGLCARHGLDFAPRAGPWSHAEVRNGGLPDWLLARDCTPRTNVPAYLEPVRTWFAAIAGQLRGPRPRGARLGRQGGLSPGFGLARLPMLDFCQGGTPPP